MNHVRLFLIASVAAVGLIVPGSVGAGGAVTPLLTATVGSATAPEAYQISLADSTGAKVTHVDPGQYTIVVHDSSALYLAIELLELPVGSEVITSPLTFSTDIAPIVKAGCVPVFVDVEPDTFNVDVSKIEEMISSRTRAMLFPNLIGNAPDWDVIRSIADRHDLRVIEDSCDGLGVKFRGTRTWKVTFAAGKGTYRSDAHKRLRASFVVVAAS